MTRLALAASLFVLTACATTGAPAAPPKEFVATGGVAFSSRGHASVANFSEDRVVGPQIDVSFTNDGSWRGRIGDAGPTTSAIIDVNVYPNRVAGSGIAMKWEDRPDGIVIDGQQEGQQFHFQLSPQQLSIRTATFSGTFPANGDGTFGPDGIVRLTGEAQTLPAKMPQLGFALCGAFLAGAGSGAR